MMIKKQVAKSMKAGYQGSTHTTPNVSELVWRIAQKAENECLLLDTPNRNFKTKPLTDLQAAGHARYESTSLAAFNKKLQAWQNGTSILEETPEEGQSLHCNIDYGSAIESID